MNIPQPIDFSILDNYKDGWLDKDIVLSYNDAIVFLGIVMKMGREQNAVAVPTLLIKSIKNDVYFYVNSVSYSECIEGKSCKGFLAASLKSDAKQIIDLSRRAYVVMWSAINAFEVLTETENASRLKELGINVQ